MPGRQSHGRSLMGHGPKTNNKSKNQKSTSKARAHALDAFAIAAKQLDPERVTRRGRDLGLDPQRESRGGGGGKHRRNEDDDDDDGDDDDDSEEDEDEGPRKKRAKKSAFDDNADADQSSDGEGGSDSEGNEWHVGVHGDDDDSELDSDEAFGESDDDKFEGYTFRGSKSQKDEDDEDGESLGSDAIDLADALDQSSGDEDDDDQGSAGDTESGSEEESASESEEEEDDEDEADPSRVGELRNLIKGFAETDKDTEADAPPSTKQVISLDDLGLTAVKDPLIKKSVKLMKKEDKADATKKGSSKKLDVPLPRRQQDQLLRAAAYEKTNETLDRWNDTVKHNRRADHLMFPLPDTLHDAGLDNSELLPLTKKTAGTELEQTILSIMEESGLGATATSNKKAETKVDDEGEEQTISRADLKELWAQRRKERELQSREQARAKRIKKIKSKTYRKIHRKERLGDEAAELEVMRENGEIDSEEEREAAHRRRALERVGARHKESKWAKMGSKAGRAVWDDDYRAGLNDMARRNEELRKRVEGEAARGSDDEDGESDDVSEDDDDRNARLLRQLDAVDGAESDDDHPHSNLMKLAFMQRAEAQRKQLNDEMTAQIRRELEDPDAEEEDEDDNEAQLGRRTFGAGQEKKKTPKATKKGSAPPEGALSNGSKSKSSPYTTAPVEPVEPASAPGAAGSWAKAGKSAVDERKKGKKGASRAEVAELDLTGAEPLAVKASAARKPAKPTKAAKSSANGTSALAEEGDSSDDEIHLPLALRDHELVSRAFGGEDVVAEFEAEKEAIMSEDDEKMIDNTMPGWGSWTGEGVSKRAQKRNKGKVMTKKEGIKKKDRKDAKLQKVILNEKRVRKNEKYLASQLPHPFESRQQYERSLRLPVGPEWMTKESFQQATKPRVLVKQGIIAPMAKPLI